MRGFSLYLCHVLQSILPKKDIDKNRKIRYNEKGFKGVVGTEMCG